MNRKKVTGISLVIPLLILVLFLFTSSGCVVIPVEDQTSELRQEINYLNNQLALTQQQLAKAQTQIQETQQCPSVSNIPICEPVCCPPVVPPAPTVVYQPVPVYIPMPRPPHHPVPPCPHPPFPPCPHPPFPPCPIPPPAPPAIHEVIVPSPDIHVTPTTIVEERTSVRKPGGIIASRVDQPSIGGINKRESSATKYPVPDYAANLDELLKNKVW